jgi:hypothetical protein
MNSFTLKASQDPKEVPGPLRLWLYAISKPGLFIPFFLSLYFFPIFLFAQSDGLPRGANLPYSRYESENGSMGGGAALQQSPLFNQADIASEASNQKYVSLPSNGSYVQWTLTAAAQAMDLRFTMPDNAAGTGLTGSLDLYVNGVMVQTISLSSYWAYQYFTTGSDPVQQQAGTTKTFMRFDEVHFQLLVALKAGDVLKIQKDNGDALTYGVDFIELEPLPAAIAQPAGSLSVTNYGAVPNDNNDDFAAFNACISDAMAKKMNVYIPPGKFLLSDKITLNVSNMKIQGAGIWYTTIYFSTPKQFYGGWYARSTGVEISDFTMNTANNARFKYNESNPRVPGDPYIIYKAFEGTYGSNSRIHDVWEEHFEVGAWIAGYDPPYPVDITQNLVISNCRIRNNYADGVNFSQGTSNSTVTNCSVRNNGDDGLAVWPSTANNVTTPGINNSFYNNTVENQWRAGATALFGGYGHQVHHNVYKDGIASSAIRFTNDFSGFSFDNTKAPIHIYENTITNFGTSRDLFDQKRGAIEFNADGQGIFNFQFDNININNSQRHAIQMYGQNIYNMTFNNTVINGTGLDGTPDNPSGNDYGGFGIWCAANTQTATFNKLTVTNSKNGAYDVINPGSFNLIITNATVAVTGVSLNPSADTSLASGQTLQISAVINPADASNKNVTWTSSDSTIAAVDGTGKVTAKGIGTATITVTTQDGSNKTASLKVTVTPAVNVTSVSDTAVKGGRTGSFTIATVGLTSPVTVSYTLSGTEQPSGYTANPALTGSVTLTPAAPSQVIVISAVEDHTFTGAKTLTLTLNPGSGYRLGGNTSNTMQILDDNAPPCTSPVVAKVTGSAPVIDQTIDAVWSIAPVKSIANVTIAGAPAGYSGQWRALYDSTNLYLLVQVNDATLINNGGTAWWNSDAVELFIDANNTKSTTYNGINDFQLGFRWNDNTVNAGGNSVTNTTGIRFSMYATGTGYNLEAALPWSTLGTTAALGKALGMDVALDDADNSSGRLGQLASFATTTTAWQDPAVFGTVYLTTCNGGGNTQPPVANAGANQTLAAGTTSVTLQGSGSDPNGKPITYSWTEVSGPVVTFSNTGIATPVVSGLTNGSTYVFALTVNNGSLSASAQVQIMVSSGGSQPGTVTANQLSGTLTIDGNLTESAWKINTPVTKSVIGTANNTVTYGLLWDNTNLYIGVKVLDAALFGNSTNFWNGDAVEVLINPGNGKSGAYTGFDNQLIQPYNNSGLFEKVSISGVQHAWAPISGGYSVEMAIPWSQLGLTPAVGLKIGFDIANDDDDTGGGRTAQAVWFGTVNDYQNTSGFGTLVLGSGTGGSAIGGSAAAGISRSLEADSAGISLKLVPNPVVGGLARAFVTGATGIAEVRVYDLAGRQVYSVRGQALLDLNLSGLVKGVYIVTLVADGRKIQQKLLIL